MKQFYNHINILMLPTDACNMNCMYCFHRPYSQKFEKMDIVTVKHLLDITVPYYKCINIIWHGGEPLLMGLEFYKKVIALQQEYDCKISNSVQSNLTLLTPAMADFFANNNISVSGSYDGVCNEQTRGCSEPILAGRQLMVERGKKCGLIMVVSGLNINRLIESYVFFKNIGVSFSLNLYLEQKDTQKSALTLDGNLAIYRLNQLFDYWATDKEGNIHISYFQHILDFLFLQKKRVCSFTSCIGRWLGVHHDGSVWPCNRHFSTQYALGNIHDYTDIRQAFDSEGFANLLRGAIKRREKCKSCEIFDFCSGGCNNVAFNENGIENNGGLSCNILCGVYKHVKSFVIDVCTSKVEQENYNPLLLRYIIKEVNCDISNF